jgi:hypothetical protein
MTDTQAVQDSTEATPPTPKVPWWKQEIKISEKRSFSKFTRWLLIITLPFILLNLFSVKPLWEVGWRTRLYCLSNLFPVRSASGAKFAAGAWMPSKRIVVYGAPGVKDDAIAEAHEGMRKITEEIGLDVTVERTSPSPEALASLQAATSETSFDFDTFMKRRLDDRGSQYAEMVVVNRPFTDPDWAWGLAYFPPGLAVLQEGKTDINLGRHEGAHLLGYDKHDDELPWIIFGYQEALIPGDRDTLMMLLPKSRNTLSPRAHDAIVNFWRGAERDGRRYFK